MKYRSNMLPQWCCSGEISWKRRAKSGILNSYHLTLKISPFFTL